MSFSDVRNPLEGEDSENLKTRLSATLAALAPSSGGVITEPRVITWEQLQKECREDRVMVNLADQIRRGFPDSGYDMNPRGYQKN